MVRFFATVTSNGRVTIPAEIRRFYGIGGGDTVEFVWDNGQVTLVPAEGSAVEAAASGERANGREHGDRVIDEVGAW